MFFNKKKVTPKKVFKPNSLSKVLNILPFLPLVFLALVALLSGKDEVKADDASKISYTISNEVAGSSPVSFIGTSNVSGVLSALAEDGYNMSRDYDADLGGTLYYGFNKYDDFVMVTFEGAIIDQISYSYEGTQTYYSLLDNVFRKNLGQGRRNGSSNYPGYVWTFSNKWVELYIDKSDSSTWVVYGRR